MRRLWKYIPPCLSDIMGLQALMDNTKGVGIVDDASAYKPLRYKKQDGERTGGKGIGYFGTERLVASNIREADIITGTAEKVWRAAGVAMETYHPDFALLATAPCAAMIGSDLTEAADRIRAEYGIPAAVVNLDGQKDYLYGVSMALEELGKLLLEKRDTIPDSVNLLGCQSVDWSEDMVRETEAWLEKNGFRVLSRWGSRETTVNLKNASAAAVNLVVNVSGLRLARYMEQNFDIPYVVGAPFGADRCRELAAALRSGQQRQETQEAAPEALVIGEQLMADAVRRGLEKRGFAHVRVYSFYEMDKQEMCPGDKKLVSEDELSAELANENLRVVFGDADCRMGAQVKWVPLPNQANQAPSARLAPFSMTDGALDRWLDEVLKEEK
ncbi:hypothetical protein I5Q83_13060 [Enterocloster clostridioformis]|uniref:nitrogenase component 1 n=1 Tax=Enterocloster clostridioformis TaxID=1531 RepID=UPI00080CBA21|nr:nitrogenase component 1 [Enterocloster clostridioformis]QQR03073.1 hypothetical protein I5Q83_13060 [Enterocloster clostridioformis]